MSEQSNNNSGGNQNGGGGRNNNHRRRRHHGPNDRRPQNGSGQRPQHANNNRSEAKSQGNGQGQNNQAPRHHNNNQNNNNNNNQSNNRSGGNSSSRNRRPKAMSPSRVVQKYDNLLDQHLVARKKYFEIYGVGSDANVEKIEQNFFKTLYELRQYENGLRDWQKDVIEKKVNPYPEDRAYSQTHNLSPKGELVPFAGEFPDEHRLTAQVKGQYANDKEESIGTIEDYNKYKDIV